MGLKQERKRKNLENNNNKKKNLEKRLKTNRWK